MAIVKKVLIRCCFVILIFISLFVFFALASVEPEQPCFQQRKEGEVPQGVIRFHVIGSSDNSQDRQLKLAVRNAVLDYLKPEIQRASDSAAAAAFIKNHLSQIKGVAEKAITAAGFSDQVQVFWGVFSFPAKPYGRTVLPAGSYQALKIVIGNGEGKNWWCVLFPPLCYVDLTRTPQDLPELSWNQEELPKPGLLVPQTRGAVQEKPRLAWKLGELLEKATPRLLLSRILSRHTS